MKTWERKARAEIYPYGDLKTHDVKHIYFVYFSENNDNFP